MSEKPGTEAVPITAEEAALELRDDDRFEMRIFHRAIVIVLFIAVVLAARALLV